MVAPLGAPNPGHPRVTEGTRGHSSEATAASSKGFKDWRLGVFPNRIHFFLPRGNAGGSMGRTGPRRALVTAIDIHHYITRGAPWVGQWWDPWGQVCAGVLEFALRHSQWGLLSPSPFPPAQFLGLPVRAHHAAGAPPAHGCVECHTSSAQPWLLVPVTPSAQTQKAPAGF